MTAGRVGGLAVALGVGLAVAGGAGTSAAAPRGDTDATGADTSQTSAGPRSAPQVARGDEPRRRPRQAPAAPVKVAPATVVARVAEPAPRITLRLPAVPETVAPQAISTPASQPATPVVTPAPPTEPAPRAVAAITRAIESAVAVLAGLGPLSPAAPVNSPLAWAGVAVARRDGVAAVSSRAKATGEAANPIAAFFFNQTPSLNPTRIGQDGASVVTGDLNINDPDSAAVVYTVTRKPAFGDVEVDADGLYTYTPYAPYDRLGVTDTFDVEVSDAEDGFHLHGLGGLLNLLTFGLLGETGHTTKARVTVVVDLRNTAPEGTASVTDPDPETGRVIGVVTASDLDGDPLSFTGSTTTSKGVVTVATDGTFSYLPTTAARRAAALLVATEVDKTDTFSITVADEYGGSTNVAVLVTISPLNDPPVAGVSVDSPNPSTGVVTGRVTGSDPDGDPLTYTGSTTSSKGTFVVAADGAFTYTPTAAARHAAARLSAPVADKTDTFTVTVADDSGGAVTVPVTVTIAPANTAPVIGGVSVGTPNATTGLVTGSITASDADRDALSYSAAPAKGTITFSSNGSFSYTPTSAARQAALANPADNLDSFTVTVTDGYGGSATTPVTVTIAPALAPPPPAQVNFTFVYDAGAGLWSTEARNALQSSAASLASYLVVSSPVTITIAVNGTNSPSSGTLAYASVDFTSNAPGFYGTVVQSKIQTGVDSNGSAADALISYNWAYPWALGDTVGGSQYDFKAIAMHELLHAIGFLTGTGNPSSLDRNWTVYDSFLTTADGTRVINGSYNVPGGYIGNFTGGGGGLYFSGPNAVAAYGGPVPLYTPGTWASGSSVSHVNSLPGYLMNPFSGTGSGVRVLHPVEIAILRDLGYTVRDTPLVYAFLLIGLIRRRRNR